VWFHAVPFGPGGMPIGVRMPHMMISGVGRCGTTALYDGLHSAVLAQWPDCRLHYEPYLWTLGGPDRFASWRHRFQSTSALSVEGIYYHKTSPLFLRADQPPHAQFVERIYGRSTPNVLAKFIRASGRLEAFLRHSENLKIVHVCRDPIPTISSAIGLFSFFGDEFHPTDKTRFLQEVTARFGTAPRREEIRDEVDWSLLWWSFMTRAALEAKQQFPERILIVAQEQLARGGAAVTARIGAYFGIMHELGEPGRVNASADGWRGTPTNLTRDEFARLLPAHESYWSEIYPKTEQIVSINVEETSNATKQAYETSVRPDASRRAEAILSDSSPLVVRAEVARIRSLAASFEAEISTTLNSRILRSRRPFSTKLRSALRNIGQMPTNMLGGLPVSCVVTSFNQGEHLKRAVISVVCQTLPIGEILVCDDASTDGSRDLIRALERDFANVRAVFRERNVGPALNRHLAIERASLPFVTQVDGDDWIHPAKIESEWKQLQGSTDVVAFSSTAIVQSDNNTDVADCSYYAGESPKAAKLRAMLLREHPIPRDLLISKDLYLKTDGYEPGIPMYEDWSLKLRLLHLATFWRSGGTVGTYYDRMAGVVSHTSEVSHSYWKIHCIARNLDWLSEAVEPLDILDGIQQSLPKCQKINPDLQQALRNLPPAQLRSGLSAALADLATENASVDEASRIFAQIKEHLRRAVSSSRCAESVR
jgi:hypothetical protein